MGLFSKIKSSLKKTSETISRSLIGRKIDGNLAKEIEDALIMADVGVETSAELSSKIANRKFPKEAIDLDVRQFLATEIENLLKPYECNFFENCTDSVHRIILVIGVNGNGKTTMSAKIANIFKESGNRPLLVAADTFRAAAVEQLVYWGRKIGVDIYAEKEKVDAAGLVFSAIEQATRNRNDVVIVDTAGRMQNRSDLLAELEKIKRVIQKVTNGALPETALVIDGITGQAAHSQVEVFREKIGVNGIIITKLDSSAKGGALISLVKKYKIPIFAIGIGEKIEDIKPFDAKEYANAIVGL
ncbi:MAG: signal recognition particle-docking protein FtsY [Holosporaceae bacterium]|jgi:fused signal recognition particle receptor|nr:signal recognition particle-docking protein FtsY [Holosporaceae bacterium]